MDNEQVFAKRQAFLQPGAFSEKRRDPGRIHWVDGLRAALMLGVIAYHAAIPYRDTSTPVLHADANNTSVAFNWFTQALNFFQMEAFFLLAGITSAMVLTWDGHKKFLGDRVRRLGLPFLVVLVLFNPIQDWFVYVSSSVGTPDLPHYTYTWLPRYWAAGHWPGHLWFLAILLTLSALLTPLRRFLKREDLQVRFHDLTTTQGMLLVALGIASIEIGGLALAMVAPKAMYGGLAPMINGLTVAKYAGYFLFGALLQRLPNVFARFARPETQDLVIGSAMLGLSLFLSSGESRLYRSAYIIAHTMAVLTALRFLCAAARRWLSTPHIIGERLRRSAYTMYLTHHMLVIAMSVLLQRTSLPVLVKFGLVLGVAASGSFLIHEYMVRKLPVLALMLTGVQLPGRDKRLTPRPAAYTPITLQQVAS